MIFVSVYEEPEETDDPEPTPTPGDSDGDGVPDDEDEDPTNPDVPLVNPVMPLIGRTE